MLAQPLSARQPHCAVLPAKLLIQPYNLHVPDAALADLRERLARTRPPEEAEFLRHLKHWLHEETGYQAIQGTKPQTLAYALTDSPAGLAAWIAEKFRTWSDGGIKRDDMLANISLYWFTGAIGSSFWPYYARLHRPWPFETVRVPVGYAEFPKEILRPPRSLAEKTYI